MICSMKQLVIPLTEEQQALIKLTATSLDAKAATRINAALDATDSVEIDIKMLEPDGDPNMIIISLGLLAIGKIGQELNL